jgi:lipid II:glycine glycyltransferase (peptidoglycan interpeptide bridge formation enzyme)
MNMSDLSNRYVGFDEYKILHPKLERTDVYISPEWLEILSESYKVDVTFLVTSCRSEIKAVTPILIKRHLIFKFVGSPLKGFYSDFMGTAFVIDVSEIERINIIKSVIEITNEFSPDYIEFRFKESQYKSLFENCGYDLVHSATLIIDTNKSKEQLWDCLESRARNSIRKAEKNNIQVDIVPVENFDALYYYQLLQETFKRQKSVLHHPKEFFISLLKKQNSKFVIPIIAKLGEEIVSSAIFLCYDDTIFYLSGVSTNRGNQLSASNLIQWKIISFASENHFSFYNMGGLGIPSIDKFKISFGGYKVEKHNFVKKSILFKIIEPLANWIVGNGIIKLK